MEWGKPQSQQALWKLIATFMLPAVSVVGWLIAESADLLPVWLHGAALDAGLPLYVVSAAIGLSGTSYIVGNARLRSAALLLLCSTAPMALLYPWAAAPTPLPYGYVGLSYFQVWLTRYPNFGPVNIEVLAGIAALLATGFLPVIVGVLVMVGAPRRVIRGTTALALLAYVPVLIRLDIELVVVIERLRDEYDYPLYPFFGPLTRAAAMLAVLILAFGTTGTAAGDFSRRQPGSHPARR